MEYCDSLIKSRIRSSRLWLKGISKVARGVNPKALTAAMYASKRFSNFASYGTFRKTDPGLTRGFGAPRSRFVSFRAGITGTMVSCARSCSPGPDHEFPGLGISVDDSADFPKDFVCARFRDTQRLGGLLNRRRSA